MKFAASIFFVCLGSVLISCTSNQTASQASSKTGNVRQPASVISLRSGQSQEVNSTTFVCGGGTAATPTVQRTVSVDLSCFSQRADSTPAADMRFNTWIMLINSCRAETNLSGCAPAGKQSNGRCFGHVTDYIPGADRTGGNAIVQLSEACMDQVYTCPVLGRIQSIAGGAFFQVGNDTILCAP